MLDARFSIRDVEIEPLRRSVLPAFVQPLMPKYRADPRCPGLTLAALGEREHVAGCRPSSARFLRKRRTGVKTNQRNPLVPIPLRQVYPGRLFLLPRSTPTGSNSIARRIAPGKREKEQPAAGTDFISRTQRPQSFREALRNPGVAPRAMEFHPFGVESEKTTLSHLGWQGRTLP